MGVRTTPTFSWAIATCMHISPETDLEVSSIESHLKSCSMLVRTLAGWFIFGLKQAATNAESKLIWTTAIACAWANNSYANRNEIDYNSSFGGTSALKPLLILLCTLCVLRAPAQQSHLATLQIEYYFLVCMKPGTNGFSEGLKAVGVCHLEWCRLTAKPSKQLAYQFSSYILTCLFVGLACCVIVTPELEWRWKRNKSSARRRCPKRT